MNRKSYSTRAWQFVAIGALLASAAACGSDGDSADAASGSSDGDCTVTPILDQVDGLSPTDREAKLKDLAGDESSKLQMWESEGRDQVMELVAPFEEKHGLTVEVYDAGSEEIVQKLAAEDSASKVQVDVIQNNGSAQQLAADQGLLAPVTSPNAENNAPETVFPNWIGTTLNVYTVIRNPSIISDADAPASWQDLTDPKYEDEVGIGTGAWDLLGAMVGYMQEEEGMTEAEATDVWKEILGNARVYNSDTDVAAAVQEGQVGLGITYSYYVLQLQDKGATDIVWEPAVEPQVIRTNGMAIPCKAPNPASALLLLDYLVSPEAQAIEGDLIDHDVADPSIQIGPLAGTDYERFYIDLEALVPEAEKWTEMYNEMIRQ